MEIINRIRSGMASARADLAEAYRPILRGFLKVACAYYAVMLVAHAVTRPPAQFAAMGAASLAAVVIAAVGARYLHRPRSPLALDLVALAIDAVVLFNVWVALQVDFDSGKLVYFPIMAMIFAFSSVSLRQVVPCIAATLGVMVLEIREHAPGMLHSYGFIALATAVCAITVSTYLRHAILIAMRAKADAEVRLTKAERLGDLARAQSRTDELTGIAALVVAWLAAALFFGALHLPTYGWNFVQCFLIIGSARIVLLLGYVITKNVWVSAGAHIINDWAIFTLLVILLGYRAGAGGHKCRF